MIYILYGISILALSLVVFFFVVTQLLAGSPYFGKESAHIQNGVFKIPGLTEDNKGFKDVMAWQFNTRNNKKWDQPYSTETVPYAAPSSSELTKVTFINHATVLSENEELSIITDPIFSKYASPFPYIGPKRHHDPYVPLADIPKLDVVLISHNHYDHLSLESIRQIESSFSPQYIVPLNNGQFLQRAGVPSERIVELDLYEKCTYKNSVFTLEKAQHWSSRSGTDRNRYLWGSFMIETQGKRLFFAGDTGYNSHFKELKNKYQTIDAAIIPIGAYVPEWFMKTQHMNPADAVLAATELGVSKAIGIHFGTFKLTDEGRHDPELATKAALKHHNFTNEFLVPTIENGISIEF